MDQPPDTWFAVIERRIREFKDGTVKGVPWTDAEKRIQDRLALINARRAKPKARRR